MTKNQKIAIGAVLVVSAGALIYSLATYKGHAHEVAPEQGNGPTLSEIVINDQNTPGTPTPGGESQLPGAPVPPSASATNTLAGTSGAPVVPGTPGIGSTAIPPVQAPVEVPVVEAPKVAYTVKKGDTLHGIAKRELGSENKWKDILAANPGLNPSKLKIGMSLQMPAKASAVAATSGTPGTGTAAVIPASNTGTTGGFTPITSGTAPAATGATAPKPKPAATTPKAATSKVATRDGVQIYTVRDGDTLRSISKEVYRGDEQKWENVFKLNRDVIGSDPGRLEPGTILILPASGK